MTTSLRVAKRRFLRKKATFVDFNAERITGATYCLRVSRDGNLIVDLQQAPIRDFQ
jgi:hypothetical protein